MPKIIRLAIFIFLMIFGIFSFEAQAAAPKINVLQVKGAINPLVADYIKNGIEQSEKDNAIACIIQMDTPGGLDTAMRDIVQSITNSRVPVIVYVSPSGARAASAGAFITMSAHVAAMAPSTAIGAAHPVSLGAEGEQKTSDTMMEKVLNDASAYIRGIAVAHGRNAEWAEKAVRESVSITAEEALKQNVIDLVSPNLETLLVQLEGREVTMLGGSKVTLHTQFAALNNFDMSGIESFLYTISDPNIAYILLSIGSLGIIAELFSPGLIFPGIVGAISLLLAFFSLGMLPVNWTGVLLILLAFGLFVAEFFTSGFGLLAGGGLISLIIGSLILFKGGAPVYQVDPWLIAVVVILIGGFIVFAITRIVKTYRRRATTGKEELTGKIAVVRETLNPEGLVFYKGELWKAITEAGPVEPGEEVIIAGVDGLTLKVTKK